MGECEITITREQLATALETWERDAREGSWPERTDEQRHADNADYLFGVLCRDDLLA
jgi:hypothetical protein